MILENLELSGPVSHDTARLSQRYPPIARYGVFGVSTRPNWVRYPLSLFLAFPAWRACEVEVRYPPPHKKGILAILARYPMKTRQSACDNPLCDTISKGYCAIWATQGRPIVAQCSATPANVAATPLQRDTFSEAAWRVPSLAFEGRQVQQGLLREGGGSVARCRCYT